MGLLNWKDVEKQSINVFNQFGESKWIPFAKENNKLPRKDPQEFRNVGIGKFLVAAAMGESLEDHIDIIKKYRDRFDLITCDKGFGTLLDNGIKADYVVLCDCNVPFRFFENYVNETEGVKLICTPYANIEWTTKWKGDKYFFVNRDAIRSELKFLDIMKDNIAITVASSNVSNSMVVFMTQSDEFLTQNFAGYEEYILTGYDYSWRPKGNYYAFKNPIPKRHYMNHRTLHDVNFDIVFTSENLLFSVKWLYTYTTMHKMPIVNCSQRGILDIPMQSPLEARLKMINPDPHMSKSIRAQFDALKMTYQNYKNNLQAFEQLKGGLKQW